MNIRDSYNLAMKTQKPFGSQTEKQLTTSTTQTTSSLVQKGTPKSAGLKPRTTTPNLRPNMQSRTPKGAVEMQQVIVEKNEELKIEQKVDQRARNNPKRMTFDEQGQQV